MQPSIPAVVLATLVATAASTPGPAAAEPAPVTGDVELDPIAYALAGHSLHVGLGRGRWRVDLGNFALALPAFAHADDGFDVAFTGYGAKLQYFVQAPGAGWFVGVDGGVLDVEARRAGTDLAAHQRRVAVGVDAGYRFTLPHGFHVTPWLGVGYQLGADPIDLGGGRFEPSALSVFPTVHLGYSFR